MSRAFDELVSLLQKLRGEGGCPWDRKQTHQSLKPNLLEETYEVLDTIDEEDPGALREELGDLLLQVLFHAQIEAENKNFTIDEVMGRLREKLMRRHPHVFGGLPDDECPQNADEVLARWEVLKQREREQRGDGSSLLDGIPKTLPGLLRAHQIQRRAARVGFDWSDARQVMEKLEEEWRELKHACAEKSSESGTASQAQIEAELGDVLFTLVNLARFLHVNPEEALQKANVRFIQRFRYIEEQASRAGKSLQDLSLEEMDRWWNEAKRVDRENTS